MAIISDTTKIDKSFKFVSGKSYTTNQKGVDNEDAPGGFIVGTSSIFSQDAGIPLTAPGVSTSILTFYDDGTGSGRFRMTYDISSPLNRAWYASTDGSTLTLMRSTRQGNWVPPTFGNYTIRIFLTKTTSTTAAYLQEIFFSDATSPLFDYKAGILTFESDPLAAYAGIAGGPPDGIQISAYRYTGPLLSQIFDGNGNFTGGLSDFGTSTSVAKFVNPDKSFVVSSPNAIGTTWQQEISVLSTTPEWHGVYVLPNGRVVVVGGDSGNTLPYIAYSYGSSDAYGSWLVSNIASASSLKRLNAVWAADDNNVYAVGQTSTTAIASSTNGGLDWNTLTDPGIGSINAIWGTATTNIYIAAGSGAIRRSTNGGSSWLLQTTTPFVGTFFGLWGSSASDIYAVGTSGSIMRSTGLGTFTAQTSGTANTLRAVFGLSSAAVYVVGDAGTVLFSSNSGSTWTPQTGLPGTFYATGVWGTSNGGVTRLYISGNTVSGSGPGAVYVSDGTGTWTLQTTFSSGVAYNMYGSSKNGVYIGNNLGIINALHQNPVIAAQGNVTSDGYINATALYAKELIVHDRMFVLNKSNTIIEVAASDSGTSIKLARESASSFALNVGVTPTSFAANGILRLGNANGSNASQVEINNSSTTLNIISRTGNISMTPGAASTMLVNLGTNDASTFLRVQGTGGNSVSLFANGAVTATGAITGSQLTSTSSISASTTITAGTNITATAGTITSSGNITSTGGSLTVQTGITTNTGNVTATAGSFLGGNGVLVANNVACALGNVQIGSMASPDASATVWGMHVTVGGFRTHVAAWGIGLNPCPGGGPYIDAIACFGGRVIGASAYIVGIRRSFLAGGGSAIEVSPYVPAGTGFSSEFGCTVEFKVNVSTTGFGFFGIVGAF